MSVQDAAKEQDGESSSLLVDVREMDEYLALRAPDAALMPMSELGTRYAELPTDRSLMMICRSGARSGRATAFLLQQGYQDVRNVEGGMIAWKEAGLPTRDGALGPDEGGL